jgi:hypothetical protein
MGTKEFLFVDPKDIWNWVLGAISLYLLYWGISTIIKVLSAK